MRTAVGLLLQMSRAKFTLSLRKDGQLRYPALRLTMRRQRAGAADALVQRKTSEASGKAVALDLCLGLEIRNLVEVRVRFLTKEEYPEILQEVQPSGNYEYDKNGYQLKRGRSANDPVDLSTINRKKAIN